MSTNTFHTQSSYSAVLEALIDLPQEMVGDKLVVRDALQKCGLTLLELISSAFIIKSLGGTDEAGDRWAPLQQSTVEARAKRRGVKLRNRKRRQITSSDDPTVRRAKAIVKGKSPSRYNKYPRKDVAILVDSGGLLDSLSPNSTSSDQVFDVSAGSFAVGTRRVGASAHHRGTSKLPQRRLWPATTDWPDSWWDRITKDLQGGAVELIKEIIRGAM